MEKARTQRIEALLFDLLPVDGALVGNAALLGQLRVAAKAADLRFTEAGFAAAREALIAAGLVVKGRGQGGSTGRVRKAEDMRPVLPYVPAFTLEAQVVPAELPFNKPRTETAVRRTAPAAPGDPQVLSYRHPDKRKNNPEVGLVSLDSDPQQPKTTWAYDPGPGA